MARLTRRCSIPGWASRGPPPRLEPSDRAQSGRSSDSCGRTTTPLEEPSATERSRWSVTRISGRGPGEGNRLERPHRGQRRRRQRHQRVLQPWRRRHAVALEGAARTRRRDACRPDQGDRDARRPDPQLPGGRRALAVAAAASGGARRPRPARQDVEPFRAQQVPSRLGRQRPHGGLDRKHELDDHGPLHAVEQRDPDRGDGHRPLVPRRVGSAGACRERLPGRVVRRERRRANYPDRPNR
jgi:hypothetical protein